MGYTCRFLDDKYCLWLYMIGENEELYERMITVFYSTGHSQHNIDFAKMNQNEAVRIRTNFFEYLQIRKLIRENEFVILNL